MNDALEKEVKVVWYCDGNNLQSVDASMWNVSHDYVRIPKSQQKLKGVLVNIQ